MKINSKIAFTSTMVSKVHLLVSVSGLTCLPKHPFHNFTQYHGQKGTQVDILITILPKLEKLLNINQSYITIHAFKDFQGVTRLRSHVGLFGK